MIEIVFIVVSYQIYGLLFWLITLLSFYFIQYHNDYGIIKIKGVEDEWLENIKDKDQRHGMYPGVKLKVNHK